MSWSSLHKLPTAFFGITQKPLSIKLSKLPWWWINKQIRFLKWNQAVYILIHVTTVYFYFLLHYATMIDKVVV